MQHNTVSFFDRIIATGSYLTMGLIGMIWFLTSVLLLKKPMGQYLTFNIIQSFMISILYAVFIYTYQILIGLISGIPFIGKLFLSIHVFLFETPIFHTLSLFNYFAMIFLCYLAIISLFGKLPYIPFITNIAKNFNV